MDVSQLQPGSNLSTFIQCCMQIYKPCLSMLMFPMMFTRGFATVIYFIWNALRCNGDEPQYKTLWERVTECETEMRMRIKAFLLHSSQFEIHNPEILWTMDLNYSQQFKRNRFLTWASWCVVPKGQKHWIRFKCVSWDSEEKPHILKWCEKWPRALLTLVSVTKQIFSSTNLPIILFYCTS